MEPGDVLAKFSHLLTLTRVSSLHALVAVSELWLPRLTVGDSVELTIDALPGQTFAGSIGRIHPTVDPATRQGKVEVVLEPVPPGARPGQFCRVHFQSPPFEALMVPFASLQYDAEGEYVMRVDAGDLVHRVAVSTSDGFGERLRVVFGLAAGDRVVVRGLLGLEDGKRVQLNEATDIAGPAAGGVQR